MDNSWQQRKILYMSLFIFITSLIILGCFLTNKSDNSQNHINQVQESLWNTGNASAGYTRLIGQKLWPSYSNEDNSNFTRLVGQKLWQSNTNENSCPGGSGAISSLSQVQYALNDPKVSGPVWLLQFLDMPDTQCVFGTVDSKKITDDGKTASHDLSVGIQSSPQICHYTIEQSEVQPYGDEYIKVLSAPKIIHKSIIDNYAEKKKECEDYAYSGVVPSGAVFTDKPTWLGTAFNFYCMKVDSIHPIGNVIFNRLLWNTKVTAIIQGKEYSGTLGVSTQDYRNWNEKLGLYLGTNDEVWAQFGGALTTGFQCPSSAEKQINAVETGNKWHTVSTVALNRYRAYTGNSGSFNQCWLNVQKGSRTPESCISELNNVTAWALSPVSFDFGTDSQTTISSNNIYIATNKKIIYPNIIMRIKADLLGILQTTGQPKITGISSDCFHSNHLGSILVEVKNIGQQAGRFTMDVNCPSPIKVNYNPDEVVQPGKTITMTAEISGNSLSDINKMCTVKVSDNVAKLSDSASVQVCMKGSGGSCGVKDSLTCNLEGNIEICQSDGAFSLYKECKDGCVNDKYGVRCHEQDKGCDSCWSWLTGSKLTKSPTCKPARLTSGFVHWYDYLNPGKYLGWTQDLWCPIKFGIIALGILFGISFSFWFIRNFDAIKAKSRFGRR